MSKTNGKDKVKAKIGRPPVSGAYSLMIRGELPEKRRYIRAYLMETRAGLIKDLGPTEDDLTTAQRVLVDRIITKLGIVRLIEEHVKDNGVFVKGELSTALSQNYLAYSNSIRLCLQALGIEQRKCREVLDLGKYIESKSEKQAENPS